MTLWELIKLYKNGFSDDVSDNYIDFLFCIEYENDSGFKKEYPYLYKFTKLLLQKTEIDYINGDRIIAKFSKIIDDNMELIKTFIKNNFVDSMQWILEDDAIEHGELHYYVLDAFNSVLIGATGESTNKTFCKLLESCK